MKQAREVAISGRQSAHGKKRLLPYQLSRVLTAEEMRKVAGGKCTYTNVPSADVSCTF